MEFQRLFASWGGVPTAGALQRILQNARSIGWSGAGYLAGEAPADPDDPDSPDGRFRINGALAVGRVVVLSRIGLVPVAETRSASNGTWRVDGLSLDPEYIVLGLDETGNVNGVLQDRVRAAAA